MLEHLLAIERRTGKPHPALLAAPPCPAGCEELWRVFGELHACRGSTGFGPTRITYSDIHAFEAVTGTKLRPWELEAIRRADAAWLREQSERAKQEGRP